LVTVWLMQASIPWLGRVSAQGFAFHAACWRVLEEVWSHHDVGRLFALCRSFPAQQGVFNWGHYYDGGAGIQNRRFLLAPSEEFWLEPGPATEIQRADPFHVPELQRIYQPCNRQTHYSALPPLQGNAGNGCRDVFAMLPPEILQRVTLYLATPDVAALKQASPVYAGLPLHDAFWRSRFDPGREFDFVFEARADPSTFRGGWEPSTSPSGIAVINPP
jgi:hypothetical protein